MAELRIVLPGITLTDKELTEMVASGIVHTHDGTKVTLEDLKKVRMRMAEPEKR